MDPKWISIWSVFLPLFMGALTTSLVIPSSGSQPVSGYDTPPARQPKTLNMTMGMDLFKDMLQNGVPFRPLNSPFPTLKNLFRANGTHLTWVPLGSLIFSNNGKIIGG